MSLKEQFVPDLRDTFHEPEEFGCVREFRFIDGRLERTVVTNCVWDNDTLKTRAIVQQQGVFVGSVLLFIEKSIFSVEPRSEQIIYTRELDPETLAPLSAVQEAYRVVDISDAEGEYEIYLDKVMA
jgi:hypothetical protein